MALSTLTRHTTFGGMKGSYLGLIRRWPVGRGLRFIGICGRLGRPWQHEISRWCIYRVNMQVPIPADVVEESRT